MWGWVILVRELVCIIFVLVGIELGSLRLYVAALTARPQFCVRIVRL